ncbi:MAG: methionine synthase [Candidatus Omnitrophica bacterium]|nr:Methionine synthase [bacterium]NUN95584.1 methionine synthase [Candidatus Omnitrophota bacterium]
MDPNRLNALRLKDSHKRLQELLETRLLFLDGAMGTQIMLLHPTDEDWGGARFENCSEHLALTRPEWILQIHRNYLAAGADMVETNSFGSTPTVLAEFGIAEQAYAISKRAAELARQAADEFSSADWPRFVAGSMGPTTKPLSVTGGATFDQLADSFGLQAKGLIDGGVDTLLLETAQDTLNIKAAIFGCHRAMREAGVRLPIMVSATIEPMGTMLAGQGVEALLASLDHVDLLSIGLNCATGPTFMTDHIRTLSMGSARHVSCYPNAGLPDVDGHYNETPEMIASELRRFVEEGWLNIVGGCCGTTPEYIRAIRAELERLPPRRPPRIRPARLSGTEVLPLDDPTAGLLIVGERTNVIGSRAFKRLIREGDFDQASEIARRQVRSGAHLIDICTADPDGDELESMKRLLDLAVKKVKVPIMIDSTDPVVIEEGLKRIQGKAIINSVNLEDGEERFERVVPLARAYGAALVVGCIDEDPQQGMAVTRHRKLSVAERSHNLLTGKYGVPEEDLVFDPLVFPCATGDANYIGSAAETIEGVRLIRERFPRCGIVLGISNVSFGLPEAGREVLNSVFLHRCMEAGLSMAIVNSEKLVRFSQIPEEELTLAEDLLFNRTEDPVAAFAAQFRDRASRAKVHERPESVDERLSLYILEGSKDGLIEDLDLKLREATPLEIINGPLMAGMDEVGRLFNDNQLIVAEVLQSAEAMKAAVSHLERFMDKAEVETRGRVLLATVKGDVHDIGKNLVQIILSNNGYQVIDLGIKVPPERLIAAVREHNPRIIGLSGLLVKSAQQMVVTAADLQAAGIRLPILVGGAALSRKFADTRIQPEYDEPVLYAKDAMEGLDLANRIVSEERYPAIREQRRAVREGIEKVHPVTAPSRRKAPEEIRRISHDFPLPIPPDLKRHVLQTVSLDEVFPYLNLQMLYGKHLGLRGVVEKLIEQGDETALKLRAQVTSLQDEALANRWLPPRGVYQFFRAVSEGEALVLLDGSGKNEIRRFVFPRQEFGDRLCLADFVRPAEMGELDSVALFVVSCGEGVRELYQDWREGGEYLRSHAIQALAVETAEALAEFLHERIRRMWGIVDPPELTLRDKLRAHYRGIRVSFGYPACPNLEDQRVLWDLLRPDEIGVELTEGCMMEPEASVSALVFHHPEARYFSVGEVLEEVGV